MSGTIERYRWKREGRGDIRFEKKEFRILGAVPGETGAFEVTDDHGSRIVLHLGETEKETNPDTGTSSGSLVILVDSPNDDKRFGQWQERVRAEEAASDQSYWDSPEGRAEAAQFERD